MSRLVARILLAILMLPAATIVYVLLIVAFEQPLRPEWELAFLIAGAGTWLFSGLYWFALWRGSVVWNARRIRWTLIAFLMASLCAVLAFALINAIEREFGWFIASLVAPLTWLIMATIIWQETSLERGERLRAANKSAVVCPSCGYNLTGLQGTRCPECGRLYTIDELFATQGTHQQADVDEKI